MLPLFCRHLRGRPVELCGMHRTALTASRGTHGSEADCQQSEGSTHHRHRRRHYLRSPYSILLHRYKDSGTLAEAKSVVKNFPRLSGVQKAQLDHTVELIKADGHLWEEVKVFKEVLLLTPAEYRHRVRLLQDISVSRPSLYQVQGVATVMGSTVTSLRNILRNIFDSDPVEHLLSAGQRDLRLSEATLQAARDLCTSDDQVTLKQVYLFMLKHYLSARFSEDADVVDSFLNGACLPPLCKPLCHYPSMCDVIIHCLGFSFTEVQEQPLLLFLEADNSREVLERFPSIGGTPSRELVKAHPRLLQVPAAHLESWLRLLHRHQVRVFSYTYHTTLMFWSSSFAEVERRLQSLQELQEWEIIAVSDRLFEILGSQKYTKRLLNAAQSGQIITSLSSAIGAKNRSRGKVRQRDGITPEIVSYFASTLDLPLDQTQELLAEEVHTRFGIFNMRVVLRLLLDYGFTREQVIMGLMVVNFEAGVVEQALKDLHTRPEAQPFAEWMENPFVLHLLAYCIKKDNLHLELPIKKVQLDTAHLSVPGANSTDS